jgi:hypothetical protein
LVKEGLAYFGKSGDGAPSFKLFLKDAPAIVPNTWWGHEEAGQTDEAKKEIMSLFGGDLFATPKPERLMERIIQNLYSTRSSVQVPPRPSRRKWADATLVSKWANMPSPIAHLA